MGIFSDINTDTLVWIRHLQERIDALELETRALREYLQVNLQHQPSKLVVVKKGERGN